MPPQPPGVIAGGVRLVSFSAVLPECLLSALSHPEVIMKNLRPKDEDCVLYTNFHQTDKRRFAFLELLLEPKK